VGGHNSDVGFDPDDGGAQSGDDDYDDDEDEEEEEDEEDTGDDTARVPLRTLLGDMHANDAIEEQRHYWRHVHEDEQDEVFEDELAKYTDESESDGQSGKDRRSSGRGIFDDECSKSSSDSESRPCAASQKRKKPQVRRKRGDAGPWFKCDECDSQLSSKATLRRHQKTHANA
jgi:hypothetical protein